jgi:SPP1 family predicted phage head-tail adaptor
MMRAGLLDRRIIIQRKSVSQSDSGDEIVTWNTLATVWAQKVDLRGLERFAAAQFVGHAIRTFRIRWSITAESVNVKDRLFFDDRVYDITDVREIGRREGIEIDCYAPSEQPVVGA